MGFDYASLIGPPTPVPFTAENGDVLNMELNLSLVTAEFLETLESTNHALGAARKREPAPEGRKRRGSKKKATKAAAVPEPETPSMFAARVNEMKFMATTLGGPEGDDDPTARVIAGWDLTRKGKSVKPSFEFFYGLPYSALSTLFTFCCFEAAAPKKTT